MGVLLQGCSSFFGGRNSGTTAESVWGHRPSPPPQELTVVQWGGAWAAGLRRAVARGVLQAVRVFRGNGDRPRGRGAGERGPDPPVDIPSSGGSTFLDDSDGGGISAPENPKKRTAGWTKATC